MSSGPSHCPGLPVTWPSPPHPLGPQEPPQLDADAADCSLRLQDVKRCLNALEELGTLQVTSQILQKNTDVVATLKKVWQGQGIEGAGGMGLLWELGCLWSSRRKPCSWEAPPGVVVIREGLGTGVRRLHLLRQASW